MDRETQKIERKIPQYITVGPVCRVLSFLVFICGAYVLFRQVFLGSTIYSEVQFLFLSFYLVAALYIAVKGRVSTFRLAGNKAHPEVDVQDMGKFLFSLTPGSVFFYVGFFVIAVVTIKLMVLD
ncbi:hypothetical protein [Parahaliea aestuarii]|uniref:Uncharacterized protein n=1 Tax=Parahaliea aestuarii TaxID=1852021 RepID=A0A5C8ZT28_9GAMM|nr:hypothetical protein [Parahaliea aestuarii]TXS90919.1 hypothetical protein FVW59_11915 [Parahaliea aestuarii]